MRWSENETHQFVKIYLSHECLWNPVHTNYKSKDKRLKAYRDIIVALNDTTGILLNETELKIKIKNLRSTYSQEVLKIKQRSSPNYTYTPNLKWFGEWHKYFSVLKKPTEDTSFDSRQDISEDPCPKIWLSQNEDHLQEQTLDPFPGADEEYTLVLKPEQDQTLDSFPGADEEYNLISKSEPREVPHIIIDRSFRHKTISDSRYECKRNKMKRRSPSSDSLNFRGSTDSNTDCGEKDDEFDIYGKYIASQLRKMDLQRALRLQLEIQSLVSEARISDLNIK